MLLDQILYYVPCPIFWKNLDGVFLGCNKLFLEVGSFSDYTQLVGKKDAELPWKKYEEEYYSDDQYVITTGKTITRIENIPLLGKIIVSETTKAPLRQNGEIIGILGICLDITDRTEKERLQLENQAHKTQRDQQLKFKKIVDQVAHDIRSPVASLNILMRICTGIAEEDRIAIRSAITRIDDIAGNLLDYFKFQQESDNEDIKEIDQVQKALPLLVSTDLLEILTEKRSEYSNIKVEFTTSFRNNSYFAFIHANSQEFKRAISNIINNAIDALNDLNRIGLVTIHLDIDSNNNIKIIIEDNGKGIPQSIIQKIMNAISVTAGKKHGHGIGLGQVRDMLRNYNGSLSIESVIDVGTRIILTFPLTETPTWFASKIELNHNDLIVILDDDPSIHKAWDIRFNAMDTVLRRKHFTDGAEVVGFINGLNNTEKNKLFLLTDYELLKQNLNGLEIINQINIKRSILVTSHYSNPDLHKSAIATNTKILPKQLAHEIEIIIR